MAAMELSLQPPLPCFVVPIPHACYYTVLAYNIEYNSFRGVIPNQFSCENWIMLPLPNTLLTLEENWWLSFNPPFFLNSKYIIINNQSLHKTSRGREKQNYKTEAPYISGTPMKSQNRHYLKVYF
jgi:hypothetical protein